MTKHFMTDAELREWDAWHWAAVEALEGIWYWEDERDEPDDY